MRREIWIGRLGKLVQGAALACGVSGLVGCASLWKPEKVPPVMTARFTAVPVQIDGVLDDAAWKNAVVYPLQLSAADVEVEGKALEEAGEVRIAWDDTFFYLGVKFTDSDIVAEGQEDQLHHYLMGDLAELFLKPANQTWYWEMYVTPMGKKTTLWFPGRGRLGLKSSEDNPGGLRVAAQSQGSCNQWEDRDTSWTGEMAVPLADLTRGGQPFGVGAQWTILVSRYNYSRYLPWKELSMTPQLSKTNYHLLEDYAILNLVK